MKASLFSLFITCGVINTTQAQYSSTTLDFNNAAAHISNAGTLFYDFNNNQMGYEIPSGSGKHALYTTQFWFAGKDDMNTLHFVQGGFPGEGKDIFSGPISDQAAYNTPAYAADWGSSIWHLCQAEIDQFRKWMDCQSGIITEGCDTITAPSNETLQTIYTWPGNGNPTMGQSPMLAPFFDANSDQFYEPNSGDYPIIKGCCAVYMIQNDRASTHTYSNTLPIGIEVHTLFYQYQNGSYIDDVTFVDVTAINKGGFDFTEFAHSIVVDADLGNYSDDYFGCDSAKNVLYFYNADNNDEDISSIPGYGTEPPAIGIVSLNQPMQSCVPFTASATTVAQKWNLMNGLQPDGTAWQDPNTATTSYVYSGNPLNASEWSALSANATPGEATAMSSFNYGDFYGADTLKQSYAIIYARSGNNLENAQQITTLAESVKLFYDTESDNTCGIATWDTSDKTPLQVSIAPNPSAGLIHIQNSNRIGLAAKVYDLHGVLILEIAGSNQSDIEIDLTNESSGVYLVHLISSTGVSVKKVILE